MARRNVVRLLLFAIVSVSGLPYANGMTALGQPVADSPIYLPLVSNSQLYDDANYASHVEEHPSHPNQLVIGYAPGLRSAATDEILARFGATVVDVIPELSTEIVQLPETYISAAISALAAMPHVAYVEPNYLANGTFVPNDSDYVPRQYGARIIQADEAWDITQGSPDVVVAVLDSGADMTHPDLADKLMAGYDYVNDDPDPEDDHGHGTHVSGVIAAAIDNGLGIAGIGGDVRVMAMKVLDADNTGYYSSIAQAIIDAADQGVRIINMSLGAPYQSAMLADAVTYAWERNVLLVAAAGNSGLDEPFYPAAYPEVIGVSMTDWNDEYVFLSNYGDWISLAAPGYAIYSTDWRGTGEAYGTRTGTSLAAPHVAGAAALVLAINPTSNQVLRSILFESADDKGTPGYDPKYGHGRVNAHQAVLAAGGNPLQPTTPSVTNQPVPAATKASTPSTTPQPTQTPVPARADAIYVADIDGVSRKDGKDWLAEISILVQDADSRPVAGAVVSGSWSEGMFNMLSCQTDESGRCMLESGRVRSSHTVLIFTVATVSIEGYVYQPEANYDIDGDSDGHTIRIGKQTSG